MSKKRNSGGFIVGLQSFTGYLQVRRKTEIFAWERDEVASAMLN